jgi:two-component system, NarL family, nitrate/nitrite response regulator NarL
MANALLPPTVRIVLADDHQLFREAVRVLLDDEPDFEVVGEAGSGEEAVALTLRHEPDILLLDVAMPDRNGLTVLEQIAAASKATRIILVTGAIDEGELLRALQLGARGVVLKEAGATELLNSIRLVHSGEYFVGRERMSDLITALRGRAADSNTSAQHQVPDFGLTPRERQIVSAVVNACQNKEIAERFAISEKTVKHHLTHIFTKVGVSSRLELAMFALQHRLDSTTP